MEEMKPLRARFHAAARRLCRLAAFGCALLPGAAAAADGAPGAEDRAAEPDYTAMTLEELGSVKVPTVFGASKHEQKVTEAPASISIVTRDDIQRFGYRTLADILRGVRGFYVTDDRSYAYVGMRGFNRPGDYGGRILLLIDGHRVNDPIYDSVPNQTDLPLDVDLIDRVEIIRGSGQALLGNNAFLAVINVISRRGRDFHGPEVSGSAGSVETFQGRLSSGGQLSNGVEAVVSGTLHDSAGDEAIYFRDFDDPATNDGIAENADHERAFSAFGSVRYRGLSLESAYSERKKQVPTALYGTVFNDPRHEYTDSHGFVQLQGEHAFPDAAEVLARVFYHRYEFHGDYPYATTPPDPPGVILSRDDQLAQSVGGELQLRRTVLEKHSLTGGVEYRHDFEIRLSSYVPEPAPFYQNTTSSAQSVSVYAQDEFRVSRQLILNLGLRLDDFSTFGSTLNPRVVAIYSPREATALKLVYGTGFRAPNAYERTYASTYHAANPGLKPETVASYELIWEQAIGSNLRTSVSGFRHDTTDLIDLTTDASGNDIFENVLTARTSGAEFEIEGHGRHDLRARASYTFARTEEGPTHRPLDNSPRHLAKFGFTAPLLNDRLHGAVEVQYTGPRNTVNGDQLPGVTVANLTLFSRRLWPGTEASISLYNVLDQEYDDPGDGAPDTIPQRGRTFRVKLTYRFQGR